MASPGECPLWLVAALVLTTTLAGCGGTQEVPITQVEADGPELKVGYTTNPCVDAVSVSIVDETASEVKILVEQSGGDDCDDPSFEEFAFLDLEEVLGNRDVIDASTGKPVSQ